MKALTLEQVRTMMDEYYTLVHIDNSCNLNNSINVLNECIKEQSASPLHDYINDYYFDTEYDQVKQVMQELKNKCIGQGYTLEHTEDFFETYEGDIRDEIQNRDDSNILAQLLRNTDNRPICIQMHSNFDCINSHYFEQSYSYYDSYFGDMVNRLNLNPHEVEKIFKENNIEYEGHFPDMPERNGHEFVSYSQFAEEISNSVSPANLLTFMAVINIEELLKADFCIGQITIPKGNCCGLYSPTQGGGSLMEMELQKDLTLSLSSIANYDYIRVVFDADTDCHYALKDIYGVIDHFFGNPTTIMKEDLMFCSLGNGVTVCDKKRKEHGDYMSVAHISYDRQIQYYSPVTDKAREKIRQFAETANMGTVFCIKPLQ